MFWQNLVFAFITPIVLIVVIAAIIVGLGSSLLWIVANGEYLQIGRALGALMGLHGHDIGKGLAVAVALIYATVILVGASIVSRMGPQHGERTHH
jgi:hypothetical protein